jgi:hypothetical protein
MKVFCKNRPNLRLAIAPVALFTALAQARRAESQSNAPQTGACFRQDARGLEKQYEPLLAAYSKGDDYAIEKEFSVFLIPDKDKWFASYFEADVNQLKQIDRAKAEVHKKGFINTTSNYVHTSARFIAHCTLPDPNDHSKVEAKPDAPQPTRDVPVEQFRIEFSSHDGQKFSELANFVYVNGAFRYLRNGASPFWSRPERPKKNASEAEN